MNTFLKWCVKKYLKRAMKIYPSYLMNDIEKQSVGSNPIQRNFCFIKLVFRDCFRFSPVCDMDLVLKIKKKNRF